MNSKLEEIQSQIETQLEILKKPNIGYSILGYEQSNVFDIYITTETIENFYFLHFDEHFFDLFGNPIKIIELENHKYDTAELIENNYYRILKYTKFFIKESELLFNVNYHGDTPSKIKTLLDSSYIDMENANYQEALEKYTIAIESEPHKGELYKSRASCYTRLNDYEMAIEDICKNGISNPVSNQNIFTFTYEDLANVYKISNDYENAIKYYSVIQDNEPKQWIYQLRAECYKKIGKYDLATKDIKNILRQDRKIEILLELAKLQIKTEKKNEAVDTLNEIINFKVKKNDEWIMKMMENQYKTFKDEAQYLLDNI